MKCEMIPSCGCPKCVDLNNRIDDAIDADEREWHAFNARIERDIFESDPYDENMTIEEYFGEGAP